jgi:hypothetical protein
MSRLTPLAILLAFSTLGAAPAPRRSTGSQPLVVHEWGTFTSIAGQDGRAVQWLPLSGPPDLPCFVDRLRLNLKGGLPGTIRMETPVLYFYAPAATKVNVNVRFRQGLVTEWYPHADVTPSSADGSSLARADFAGGITWTGVKVSSGSTASFPTDGTASHYYVARNTDASPLQAGSSTEKFLFYRGVGGFQPPLAAAIASDGKIVVTSPGEEAIGDVILFENRGGTIAYDVRHASTSRLAFDPPVLDGESATPVADLERILVAHGLYQKEARAMVETWRDSWFEEGTRLFYLVPPRAVDSILPLAIDPRPSETARVFVGRMELITSTTEHEVEAAFNKNDWAALGKYARFLPVIADRVLANASPLDRARIQARLQSVFGSSGAAPAVCPTASSKTP